MRAWVALLKKDFKLTRTVFFVGLVINLLIAMLTLYMGRQADHTLLIFLPLAVAIVLHVLYVPIIVFISLKIEANQLHLWLHNPGPASTLLISKIVNGLMMLIISLLMLYVMSGLLIIPKFNLIEAYWTDAWISGLLIFLHILIISIIIGVWVLFLWALYQSLKFAIGRWSWLVVIGAVIIPSWITALFETTKLYSLVTKWGSITYDFPSFSIQPIQTYTGEYLYTFIFIIGLFFLSAWIVDNKVEV
ncbi:hypothetical protein GK047_25620 [Paenibacillus sp. SYP-B3998]|uniref:Uncharacterized protein n=1 Tax=Paenibacillus sp. SYP-B3998 TaxID=2678564 RepID=A0A6G4A4W2_9BACL|nr:hypothetical protein [Paenibacillus sp. SYP-B3998]NEW09328.1 hypothetical protein [Paenibacillus sp. SYP-B3998]